ncbi:MAG TPA: hypothetical protein VJR89_28105 [Polyangiales bacterium]|nr:hypothetical protein [Polyangiales bacterium]
MGADGLPVTARRIPRSEFRPGDFAMSIAELSNRTQLDFGYLRQYDVLAR